VVEGGAAVVVVGAVDVDVVAAATVTGATVVAVTSSPEHADPTSATQPTMFAVNQTRDGALTHPPRHNVTRRTLPHPPHAPQERQKTVKQRHGPAATPAASKRPLSVRPHTRLFGVGCDEWLFGNTDDDVVVGGDSGLNHVLNGCGGGVVRGGGGVRCGW